MKSLPSYLDDVTRTRRDCCMLMADWLVENGIPDPMSDRRGTYSSRKEYMRMIKAEGGLLASCSERFGAIGLRETTNPDAGDVVVIKAPIKIARNGAAIYGLTGAICVSKTMCAVVARESALRITCFPIIKAWSWHHA